MFVPTSFPHLSVLGGSLSCNHGSKDVHHRLTKTVSHKAVVNSAYARKHDVNMLSIYLGRKFADCPTGHLMVTLWPEFFFFFCQVQVFLATPPTRQWQESLWRSACGRPKDMFLRVTTARPHFIWGLLQEWDCSSMTHIQMWCSVINCHFTPYCKFTVRTEHALLSDILYSVW